MGALRINADQLSQLQGMMGQLNNGVTVKDVWAQLSSFGDTYAAAAVDVFTPGSLAWNVVRSVWNSSNADFSKFNAVAATHLRNYLNEISSPQNQIDGQFKLPTTRFIEDSYVRALELNGLNAYTAVDVLVSKLRNSFDVAPPAWHSTPGVMILESERVLASNPLTLAKVNAEKGRSVWWDTGIDAADNIAAQAIGAPQQAIVEINRSIAGLAKQFGFDGSFSVRSSGGVSFYYNAETGGWAYFDKLGYGKATIDGQIVDINPINWRRDPDTGKYQLRQNDGTWRIAEADGVENRYLAFDGSVYLITPSMAGTSNALAAFGPADLLASSGYGEISSDAPSPEEIALANVAARNTGWAKILESYPGSTLATNGEAFILIDASGEPIGTVGLTSNGNVTVGMLNGDRYIMGSNGQYSQLTVDEYNNPIAIEYSSEGVIIGVVPFTPATSQRDSIVHLTDQQSIAVLNDISSLIGSIQGGKPLPVLGSGLRLLNTLDNLDGNTSNNIPYLGSTAAVVGGLASLYSLTNALENGDALTQVSATLNTLNYVNTTFPTLLGQAAPELNTLLNGATAKIGEETVGGLLGGQAPGVLPALGLVMSIRSGDPVGIATGLIGVINPVWLTTSPVGWIIAGVQILSALFNEPPESWGTAKIVFDQNGQLKLDSVGEGSGPERVRIQLQGTLDVLNAMLAQAQAGSPNNPLGIVPQRMPSITWREARQDDKGYAITDIDPITGEQRYPYLRWDDTGTPFSSRPDLWQPDPTDPNIRASFNQQLVESALKREAIAPQWEVDTARIQQEVGDPNAGLSETERAAKMGLGATYNEAGEPVGQFRALTVDLDGDGQISTVAKDAAGNDVAFNWDDAGFQKQVAWVQPNDGFLFLDRNLNGVVDSGSELFSNSRVSDNYKGVRSLESVDANRDGKITNVDPVFKELKIWQDVNGDGDNVTVLANGSLTLDPGELQSLTDLGITELDYVNGRLTRDGDYFALRSQQLEADAEGTLVNAVESGIVINYSEGQQQFIISKVTSLVGGADRVDNVFEDGDPFGAPRTTPQEITIPVSLLLANDTIDPVTAATLSVTEVLGAVHGSVRLGDLAGQPAVFFTPEENYNSSMGEDARFEYVVRDGDGATKTVQVTIPLTAVNDVPSVSYQLDQKSIYGYGVLTTQQVYSDGEGGYTVTSYSKDQGVPFDAPYRTVIGRQQVGTQTVGWGEDQTEVPVYGELIDTGIPLTFMQDNFGNVQALVVMGNVRYQIPGNPSTVLHDAPIEVKTWNDGVVSAIDPDGSAAFSYEIVGQGVYGKATIDANTGRFAYTGRRYVESDEAGNAVNANTDTDKAARYEETFNDVFTVRVHDGSGGYIDQTVTVPHFGPRPNASVESGGKKPIAIDLDGDGFEFINIDDSNIFLDVNGDGWRRRTAWVGADDGLLALDENGNGVIDSGLELSFTRFVNGAQTDLEGLRAFDTNKDGVFSAADAQWSKFGVWQDANSNGLTDAGEFKSLTDMGIAEIGMTSDGQFRVINGQTVHGVGNVTKTDGSTLAMADVTLQYTNEVQTAGADGSEQIAQLLTQQNGQSFSGTTDKDLVFGTGGSDNISTGDADDAIVDDAGDDVIDAGAGNDLIFSGTGNDVVLAGNGDDSVFTGEGNDAVFGDAEGGQGNDLIMLAGGNDVAFGGAGNDFIGGGTGNDILSGDAGDDKLFGEDGWDALMGGAGNDELWGMTGNDYLEGGDGNDLLVGGAGVDVMQGGAGDDTYEVDNLADIVDETVGGTVEGLAGTGDAGGFDTVRSAVDYTLGALLENLTLTGETQLTGTGNAKDNVLIGNAASNTLMGLDGNDLLDGAAGADTLVGGQGNDTYVIDNAGDQVVEAAGGGIDTVRSRISAALSANVENLTLIGINAINGSGNELDNRIVGNAAANVIDGGAGNDQMSGGQGDDVYLVDSAGDIVSEAQGQGIDAVRSSVDYALTANVEDLELVGSAVSALGNDLANRIFGNAQDNLIDGGVGADVMAGRLGNDLYRVDNSQDVIIEAAGEGLDQVVASVSYTLSDNVENLTLIGDAIEGTGNALSNTLRANVTGSILRGLGGDDVLIGDQGNDELNGGEGADRLDGQAGDDLMLGGQGNDSYVVEGAGDVVVEEAGQGLDDVTSSVDYTLTANVENLQLVGAATAGTGNDLGNRLLANDLGNELSGLAGDDELIGGAGADRLLGGEGNDLLAGNNGADLLDGGAGQDLMQGGMGDDHYFVDNAADVVEEADCGLLTDIPNAGVPVTMAVMVTDTGLIEDTNGSLNAACGGIDTVTSTVDYTLTRNVENLILVGAALVGAGNELDNDITGNDSGNTLSGLEGNDHLRAGTGNDVLLGGTGQDVLVANSGNDLLDGGVGDDLMIGGQGDDVYRVDSAGDVVLEEVNAGHDKVLSTVDYTLTAQVEDLELVDAATNGVGNELANVIRANSVNSNLSGLDGDDTLLGSTGNDTLSGGAGNDVLDGGTGADDMAGGAGDDSYSVDQSGDAVVELAQDGYDTITSEINYVLPEHVERLILSGSATQGTGNELANTIIANELGNTLEGLAGDDALVGGSGDDTLLGGTGDDTLSGGAGADALDGGAGADAMVGGSDDDSYVVDDAGDLVTEYAHEGYDQVSSSINYVLPEHVEKLVLTGSAIRGMGNSLSNHLVGNGLANMLDGAQGADLLDGAGGDDRYVVDNVGDVVLERPGEGNDTVFTSVDYVLSANVENMVLTGSAITATGNDLNNTLVGSASANTMTGGAGNDVLAGGQGNDVMMGGVGNDTYLWNQGDGRDVITDTSGVDGVRFGAGITLDSLSAREYTVDGQRRVFISVLDADGEERADQGIDFALDATTVTRTIYDRRGRPIGTESETTYSSPVEAFVLADGTVFTLDQLKPPVVCADGTWSNDTLTGSRADDQMDGWLGNDTLYGRSGNDTLIGGNGRDRLFGEGGHDQLLGGNDDDYLQGETGNDVLDGDNGRDVLLGGAGNDNLSGGNDSDILDGGTGQDQLSGGNGEDELWAGAGDDQLSGGNDSDLLAGGAGNDLLDGGNGADVIVAGDGHDNILAGHDSDFIDAGAGDDQIDAGYGNDFIVAGKGNDRITASSGSDVIAFNRGDGADVLTADTWQQDAISLGGGIRHMDLSLTRQGNDLVLGLGQGDQITLQGWYLGSFGSGESISRLQIVNAADGGTYNASSTDRLINREVTVFDFREFVESFDRNEHCGTNGVWSADAALRSAYLYGSNSQAIGGDLAFSYATDSADQAGSATYGTDGWKDARNQMFAMGNYMQTLCAQPINTVTPWAAMQAGTSLIVEVPTGASMPIDIKPSLTQDQLVTQALNTQQQLSGQPRPSWV